MPKFCANITFLFREIPLTERFAAARDAGFEAVEILSPEDVSLSALADAAKSAGVSVALVNAPMGDFITGGDGLSAVPGRQTEFRAAVAQAREMAEALHCKRVHIGPSKVPSGSSWQNCYDVFLENATYAAQQLAQAGMEMTIEALNDMDMPTVFLSRADQVLSVIGEIAEPNVSFQFDVYHMVKMEADYLRVLHDNIDKIGHIQFADSPGRAEPGSGSLDFPVLFDCIDGLGYDGWVGAEYQPGGQTEESLTWFAEHRSIQP